MLKGILDYLRENWEMLLVGAMVLLIVLFTCARLEREERQGRQRQRQEEIIQNRGE